jgi:transcriptional regulator with XRE-family HTH domain
VKCTLTIARSTPETSFRLFLQSELARRCARNPQYSLRAFALHLGVDHSTLSQWLRGRRPIMRRSIEALGTALGVTPAAIASYVDHSGREPEDAPFTAAGLLSGDTVSLIADWYHFAILELTRLQDFRADSRWIARVLDISVDEVNMALQRLIRLYLLEMSSAERWIDKSGDASVGVDTLPDDTISRLHHQTGERSIAAVRGVPITLREHVSITMAISSRALPRAFELAARFRQQLVELLQDGETDDVYQIEVAMFPITALKRERKDSTWDAR